jgi:hypothetical protein
MTSTLVSNIKKCFKIKIPPYRSKHYTARIHFKTDSCDKKVWNKTILQRPLENTKQETVITQTELLIELQAVLEVRSQRHNAIY